MVARFEADSLYNDELRSIAPLDSPCFRRWRKAAKALARGWGGYGGRELVSRWEESFVCPRRLLDTQRRPAHPRPRERAGYSGSRFVWHVVAEMVCRRALHPGFLR